VVNLDDSVANNLRNLALAKKVDIEDLMVCLLDRDRHEQLIAHSREAGARVMLISDGDVAAAIATALPDSQIDLYMGAGGAPEGVLSAAALRCVGGQMQGRLLYENEEQIARVRSMGHADPKRCFSAEELAAGDVMFAATGVTTGPMLRGVKWSHGGAITHSIVMRSRSGTVRFIDGHHNLEKDRG
jgi:fructose-1,6-bisphosphatase II / sedoheptulose-1,7-bisphosphatase